MCDEVNQVKKSLAESYPGIQISFNQIDFNDLKHLEDIHPQQFDSILILSPGGSTIEEMDAYVISLLIRIRQIRRIRQTRRRKKTVKKTKNNTKKTTTNKKTNTKKTETNQKMEKKKQHNNKHNTDHS